jgi:membrane-associated phospholipid phosphatase
MRFEIAKCSVASLLPNQIFITRHNKSIYRKRSLLVRSQQAKEERSVSLQPPKPALPDADDAKTAFIKTTSTPFLKTKTSSNPQLTWQRISQSDAVVLLSAATLGFSYLASDLVFWHNLRWLDTGVHLFISSVDSAELHDFARHTISNTPIVVGWCGWAAAAAALLYKSNTIQSSEDGSLAEATVSSAWRHVSISVAMYLLGGGTILHGDPYLVKVIKELFQRTRPSLSSTYAFPSGHTTSAAFVIGALLFVILPSVLDAYTQSQQSNSGSNTKDRVWVLEKGATLENLTAPLRFLEFFLRENRILIWLGATATTASGRVIADVHWSTDVMAGGCLGVVLVALTVLACEIADAMVVGRYEE